MKTTLLKCFQPATLSALAIITLWAVSIRPAQAGYTVTLQQVGPNVVATGNGAINLTGLTRYGSGPLDPGLKPGGAFYSALINTGPSSSNVDSYYEPDGPTSFGTSSFLTSASSGSGDMVGIFTSLLGNALSVPAGYRSGNALSGMAIYTNKTFATLGVRPGTYVWTWGIQANQKFTLKILPGILPANGPPIVATNPAALIASFSATLNGSLHPDGLNTTFHFQYGTTTNYGLTTAPQTQTGDTFRPVSANINSLAAHTTYHFRIVASNAAGTTFGSDRTFTTLTMTGPPIVATTFGTSVNLSSARLIGRLYPHGLNTTVYFEYGTTTSYGSRTPNQIKTGNNYQNVLAIISGLNSDTTYHFRIVASNAFGTRYGTDKTFATQ